MDRSAAIARLPATYARAVRLRDAGIESLVIAERLGIEPQAVESLLQIADAKLAGLLSRAGPSE